MAAGSPSERGDEHREVLDDAPMRASARKGRSAARLAVVQALYQREVTGAGADAVVAEFLSLRLPAMSTDPEPGLDPMLDKAWFAQLVRGVQAEPAIDEMVGNALSAEWPLQRLERVLRAILRAGAYELLRCADVPARAVINEYVELAHDFFAGREPALVNAVLDRLARVLRADECGAAPAPAVPEAGLQDVAAPNAGVPGAGVPGAVAT